MQEVLRNPPEMSPSNRSQWGSTPEAQLPDLCGEKRAFDDEEALIKLFEEIDSLLPPSSVKIVQFVGPKGGEGVTTLVQDFACCVARRLRQAVVVIQAGRSLGVGVEVSNERETAGTDRRKDIDVFETVARDAFGYGRADTSIIPKKPEKKAAKENHDSETVVRKIKDLDLYLVKASLAGVTPSGLKGIVKAVGKRVNLVAIDSSSAALEQNLAHCRYVDGVVLVLDVNKIDPSATERLIGNLRGLDVNLLGIVLNRATPYDKSSRF